MPDIDHSLTYKVKSLKNIPHRHRLKAILGIMGNHLEGKSTSGLRYADFGCSNGYITNLLSERFRFRQSYGFDSNPDILCVAKQNYPGISFEFCDLNTLTMSSDKFDIVTSFETLEHVGNVDNALCNLLNHLAPRGLLLITVPIEVGVQGIAKLFIKKLVYRYSFQELPDVKTFDYAVTLAKGMRISVFRKNKNSWGTHFGFDYHDIDDILQRLQVKYRAFNRYTTRFYIITDTTKYQGSLAT